MKQIWIVSKSSAYRSGHECILGSGSSRNAALENAYGPKPWTPYVKRSMKDADVQMLEVTAAEAERILNGESPEGWGAC